MNYFWEGFEKRAVSLKNLKNIKNVAKSFLAELSSAGKGSKEIGSGITRSFKGVGDTIGNIAEGTAGLKEMKPALKQTLGNWNKVTDDIAAKLPEVTKSITEAAGDLSKIPKLVAGGMAGGVSIYGASKILGAPRAIQEYGYYKSQKQLAQKQLDLLSQDKPIQPRPGRRTPLRKAGVTRPRLPTTSAQQPIFMIRG